MFDVYKPKSILVFIEDYRHRILRPVPQNVNVSESQVYEKFPCVYHPGEKPTLMQRILGKTKAPELHGAIYFTPAKVYGMTAILIKALISDWIQVRSAETGSHIGAQRKIAGGYPSNQLIALAGDDQTKANNDIFDLRTFALTNFPVVELLLTVSEDIQCSCLCVVGRDVDGTTNAEEVWMFTQPNLRWPCVVDDYISELTRLRTKHMINYKPGSRIVIENKFQSEHIPEACNRPRSGEVVLAEFAQAKTVTLRKYRDFDNGRITDPYLVWSAVNK